VTTIRKAITWRLPIHLLTEVYRHAEFEGMSVTAWVERSLTAALPAHNRDQGR